MRTLLTTIVLAFAVVVAYSPALASPSYGTQLGMGSEFQSDTTEVCLAGNYPGPDVATCAFKLTEAGELLGILVHRDADDVGDTAGTVQFWGLRLRYRVNG